MELTKVVSMTCLALPLTQQDKSIDVYGREEEDVNKQVADLENL